MSNTNNQQQLTDRELSNLWWVSLPIENRKSLTFKYFPDLNTKYGRDKAWLYIPNGGYLTIFEAEGCPGKEQTLEQPIESKEVDLLELYKNDQWGLAGNMADENGNWLIWDKVNCGIIGSAKVEKIAEFMTLAPRLASENKSLKEQNKALREALRKMYITFNNIENHAEDWLILDEAKAALSLEPIDGAFAD